MVNNVNLGYHNYCKICRE